MTKKAIGIQQNSKMRTALKGFLIFATIWLAITEKISAQVNAAVMFPIVGNYVSSLQSGNIEVLRQLAEPFLFQQVILQTSGNGIYPIIRDLGPIGTIQLGSSASPFNFTVQVLHLRGTSEWQFVLDEARPVIITADLLRVTIQFPGGGAAGGGGGGGGFGGVFRLPRLPNDAANPLNLPPLGPIENLGRRPNIVLSMPCAREPSVCGAQARTFSNDPRLVEFLFATDRIPQNGAQAVSFSGDRQSALTFGAVSVHVPETHKIGRIELPSVWKVWGIELRHEPLDEKKHFVLRQLQIMTLDAWADLIRKTQAKSALIFVHGFNTSFEDAVYRNAQIIYDLEYRGLSILYSWSSRGSALDYRYDLDSALSGRDGFTFLLKKLRDDFGIERIDVLAHSMGNLLVLDALKNSAATAHPARVDQLIMAAPDVPRDAFERQLPEIQKISAGTTLYASAADKALAASKLLAIYPRAGDVPTSGPIILPDLDTIDVTAIGDEFLGLNHTEFATNRSVMDDLKILIDNQQRASRLNQIKAFPETPDGPHYWRYVP
jgi:esterase/lipase superfamily enzyme